MRLLDRQPIRAVLLALLILALAAAAALALSGRNGPAELVARPEAQQPPLTLVTSLPLIFPEEFGLDNPGSPALDALESRYRLVPIGTTQAEALAQSGLLLLAHPLAQPAEALVELDRWVRQGGRVLILADPKLDWPSELPLGHMHRPPPYFADTGLLRHWGLRLDAPDEPGPQERRIGERRIRVSSPGTLQGDCQMEGEGLVARCALGKGRATVIADADLLRPDDASPSQTQANLQFVLEELQRLEQ